MISKMLVSATLCITLLGARPLLAQESNQNNVDRSVKPGDDFYRYANGGWLKAATIPAGQRASTPAQFCVSEPASACAI